MAFKDTATAITITIPAALFLMIAFLAVMSFMFIALKRKSRQATIFNQKIEQLNSEIESLKSQETDKVEIPEAYRQFIYNLSHEVANPLQSVQTNLENMADCSPEEAGRWRQYYAIIRHEMKRLATLTENLRLLSHLESDTDPVKREPVNLKSVIEDVIMTQAERAEAKNVSLNYQGPNRPARVLGNRDLLYEVFHNLVDNSIKYSKDSGGKIDIVLRENTEFTEVRVTDSGLGIPEQDLPFVFDTAYRSSSARTAHRTGSGLGLAIVKRIIQQHEGSVTASSVVGESTTITVQLPVYKPSSPW